MGPQGSGKGTQAELIAKEYGIEHVSTGDVLREEVKNKGPYAEEVQKCMVEGKLVPDRINDELVKKVVEKYEKNLILDGYPRNLHQAEFLSGITNVDLIIKINISDEESVNRISKRIICTATKKIYIEDKITEEDKKECESKGGELVKREDDKPESVKKRLDIYHTETSKVSDFFEKVGTPILDINGEQPVEEVFKEIKNELDKLMR